MEKDSMVQRFAYDTKVSDTRIIWNKCVSLKQNVSLPILRSSLLSNIAKYGKLFLILYSGKIFIINDY